MAYKIDGAKFEDMETRQDALASLHESMSPEDLATYIADNVQEV